MKSFTILHRTTLGETPPNPANRPHWMLAKIMFAVLCCLLTLGRLAAQSPELVKDINSVPNPEGSDPFIFCQVGSTLFFTTSTPSTGRELWKSDGTEAGTVMVKDLNTGGDSDPYELTDIGGTLYFAADDGINGQELWKSDGTDAGTVMVKNINTGGDSDPYELIDIGGTLYFIANDGINGKELWKSDGTAAGTVMVKNINMGGDSYLDELTSVGGTLYFKADDGLNGKELWKSDGTEAGTMMVKDINTGSGSDPYELTAVGGTLYFRANDGTNGWELWKSDGTAAGTMMVKNIRSGSNSSDPYALTAMDGTLYFRANDGTNGWELWKSDGTEAGTVMVKDIRSGSFSSNPYNLTAVGSTLYFRANNGTNGEELWKSDGTEAGTVMVKDIIIGGDFYPDNLTAVGGTLYFRAYHVANGIELWKSDGTEAGTMMVKDINTGGDSSPGDLTAVGGTLYFSANNGTNGEELWKSDGTEAGTVMVKDIWAGSGDSQIGQLTSVDGKLYFSADASGVQEAGRMKMPGGSSDNELWKSDGTEAGTVMVKDINIGGPSNPTNLTDIGGTLYFTADDGTNGWELWKSNGTEAGTERVKDIWSGSNGSFPGELTVVGGTLYFNAYDPTNGNELWKSDGTEAGTMMVKNIRTGSNGSFPGNLAAVGSTLYFNANDGTNGGELWKSDGTEAGTMMVKNIHPSDNSQASYLTDVGGTLYFSANNGTNHTELWKSNGTEAGTVMVKDINIGGFSYPADLTDVGGTLYFSANDGTNGTELWKSNGTEAGTMMVKNIHPSGNSQADYLINVGGTLYFTADDGINGIELWKSNGTEAGTVMIKNIRAGSFSSFPHSLTNLNGTLYFFANDGINGIELWKSDGTEAGTVMAFSGNSELVDFNSLVELAGTVYFNAASDEYGSELFKLAPCVPTTETCNGVDDDCDGTIDDVAATCTAGTRTWTGAVGTDWNDPCNWNPTCVPTASDDVIIADVTTNDPTISAGTAALAKSVVVNAGGVLTIDASDLGAGSLTIDGYVNFGDLDFPAALGNDGTVHNNGTITIGATVNPGLFYGIYNRATFNNSTVGQIHIDRPEEAGILNEGGTFTNTATITIGANEPVGYFGIANNTSGTFSNTGGQIHINHSTASGILNESGTFNNTGTITLGSNQSTGEYGLSNHATFNNTDGEIKIDHSLSSELYNEAGAMFTNAATINIGSVANDGANGLRNLGTFENNMGGQINIDGTSGDGLINEADATFTNAAAITIGALIDAGDFGIRNFGTFENNTGGQIKIDRLGQAGLINYSAFSNAATITIGAILGTTVGSIALENHATFNNTGGQISIDRSTYTGLLNSASGIFTNAAAIVIGANEGVGDYGLENQGTFNNNTGGQISIDFSTVSGLVNSGASATFTNAATIAIGANVSVGNHGILNLDQATLLNNACGQITTTAPLNNTTTITNAGLFTVNTALAHTNSGTLTNDGIIAYPEGNPIPGVTNQKIIAQPQSGVCVIPDILTLGNTTGFTIGSTWYLNDNLSGQAGTYDQATNTFTNTHLLADTETTVYFSATDNTNTCARTVSIKITATSAATTETCNNLDDDCDGTIDDVAADCTAGTRTWTGAISTDWNTACNWSPACVPTAADDVIIEDVTNDPTITAGTAALAKSVLVNTGGVLTIDGTGTLTINGSVDYGANTFSFGNEGTVHNDGTITIGSTASTREDGLYNTANFNNNAGGQINIDRSEFAGLRNSGTFTNAAAITFGANESVGENALRNDGIFDNMGGQINIDNTTSIGLFNTSTSAIFTNAGTTTNAATITIGANTSVGTIGVHNASGATFHNNPGGELNIDNSTQFGIYNEIGTFTNAADIIIGANASVGNVGLINFGTFNNTGGQINIDNSTDSGLSHFFGTFTNSANLTIGANASVGQYGLYNEATFNNNTDGAINIDRSDFTGLRNAIGTFTNAATITIGANASVGSFGLYNQATFNNNTGGHIEMNNSTLSGLYNEYNSFFTNHNTIIIGANTGIYGIENEAELNNEACGVITLNANFYNTNVMTNDGLLTVNTTSTHNNSGTVTNNGIISYPQDNPINGTVTNNEIIAAPISGTGDISPALSLGAMVDFEIAANWFLDEDLTDPAGTFDETTNTFTNVALESGVPTTVYFSINDATGDCDRTVSMQITWTSPCTPTTEVCDGVDNDCDTEIDEGVQNQYFADADGDTYGDAAVSTMACSAPTGYVANDDDCDDTDANVKPGATEIAGDEVDQNCDGAELCFTDADDDGYRLATTVNSADTDCDDANEGQTADGLDCDDTNASIKPGATEIAGDEVDQNCDGAELCFTDADDDGYRLATTVNSADTDCDDANEGQTADGLDCDDTNANVNPEAAEVCNLMDDDCDGTTDEDEFAPTPLCQNTSVALTETGTVTLPAAQLDGGSTDVYCTGPGTLAFAASPNTFDCDDTGGGHTVTLTVTDAAGNTASCQATVTVLDVLHYSQEVQRTASDGLAGDKLGWGLGLGGQWLIAGAPDDKIGTQNKQGSAYAFSQNQGGTDNWGQVKQIRASDGATIDYFGNAISMDGSTVIVGAHGDNVGAVTDAGSAYIFEKDLGGPNNWGQRTNITARDGATAEPGAYDYFANAVSLKNGRALVGAAKKKVGANTAQGVAYIYEKDAGGANAWGNVKKLTASDGAANNFFGQSVAQSGDLALVGASGNLNNRGAVYAFDGGAAWAQSQKLTASDAAVGDGFGTSLSMSGTYALVGAPNKTTYSGAAYIFKNNAGTWAELKKLAPTAPVPAVNDRFGTSVALAGDYAYVSAVRGNGNAGAVYVFHKDAGGADNWGQIGYKTATGGASGDQFGYSLAVSGERVALGANLDDVAAKADQGSVYVFKGEGCPDMGGKPEGIVSPQPRRLAVSPSVQCSPNPFRDELTVEISASGIFNLASEIVVMDAVGRVAMRVELPAGQNRHTLRTDELRAGMYFVQVSSQAGVQVVPVVLVR